LDNAIAEALVPGQVVPAAIPRPCPKRLRRGRFQCDPNDDWNWFVPIGKGTSPIILSLLDAHGFAASDELRAMLAKATATRA
jgi:hypothetical protein